MDGKRGIKLIWVCCISSQILNSISLEILNFWTIHEQINNNYIYVDLITSQIALKAILSCLFNYFLYIHFYKYELSNLQYLIKYLKHIQAEQRSIKFESALVTQTIFSFTFRRNLLNSVIQSSKSLLLQDHVLRTCIIMLDILTVCTYLS